ncbi:hypothetical protein M4578_00320 [Salipiger sp. P9]|nr:hypothetical protein [Salipiger pentaromativorans]
MSPDLPQMNACARGKTFTGGSTPRMDAVLPAYDVSLRPGLAGGLDAMDPEGTA